MPVRWTLDRVSCPAETRATLQPQASETGAEEEQCSGFWNGVGGRNIKGELTHKIAAAVAARVVKRSDHVLALKLGATK